MHFCFGIFAVSMILKIIGQYDTKHIMMLLIKTITAVLNVSTYIITCITALPIGLAVVLAIMSVSIFTTASILYVY